MQFPELFKMKFDFEMIRNILLKNFLFVLSKTDKYYKSENISARSPFKTKHNCIIFVR